MTSLFSFQLSPNFIQMRRLSLLLFLLLGACLPPAKPTAFPQASTDPWGPALRALDPADAADPVQDITAVYMLESAEGVKIRVDLLDFQDPAQVSLELHVVDAAEPDTTLYSIYAGAPDERFPTAFDPALDTVTVDLDNDALPPDPMLDVLTPQDEVRSLRPDGPAPTQVAPVLLAFYDTFAGRFPAEALRRWDGAHSGPRGERHGLKHLLDAAEATRLPLTLLDLRTPENLSALDALGALPRLRQMQAESLLSLPENPGAAGFELLPSGVAYAPAGESAFPYQFRFMGDNRHLSRRFALSFRTPTYLPVPLESAATQPAQDGLPVEVRRALLEIALDDDPANLLALGGSLRDSTWGDPELARRALAYLDSRPYIRVLSEEQLLVFPARLAAPDVRPAPVDESLAALEAGYAALTAPVLVYAEAWDGRPQADCDHDLDGDAQPECALADARLLAVLDPAGARLAYLFARDAAGALHQLVGPSWQVAVGLSPRSVWNPALGEAADPGAYPGAFAETDDPFLPFSAALEGDTLTFTSEDGARLKAYRLTGTGLQLEYRVHEPLATGIALLVDPEERFSPGWAGRYFQEKTPGGLRWGLRDGPVVDLRAEGGLDLRAFNDGLALLSAPEDPDFAYPTGYTLPFPLALVTARVEGQARFVVGPGE